MSLFLVIPLLIPLLVSFGILVSPLWPVTGKQSERARVRGRWHSNEGQTELKRNRKRFLVFVVAVMVVSGLVSGLLCWLGNRKMYDKEVWHFKVTKIRHEEKWTTHETRTETYTTGSGDNKQTHTRTVHYTEDHGPYWTKYLENGDSKRINQGQYQHWKKIWANEVRTGEHKGSAAGFSRAITGGIFDCKWPKTFETIQPHSEIHSYKWKVRYSETALRDIESATEELEKMYPRPAEGKNTAPFVSYEGVGFDGDAHLLLSRVNAELGRRHEVHTILVAFKGDTPRAVINDVLRGWQLPNKNELVTFISLDGQEVKWVEVHSWIDDTTLHGTLETALAGDVFTPERYAKLLLEHIPKLWHRKEAEELDYLKVDLHWGWGLGAFLLSIVIAGGGYLIVDKLELSSGYGSRYRHRHNFTLIELMVVIAIIAILASIIVPLVKRFF